MVGKLSRIGNEQGTFLFDLAEDIGEKNNLMDQMPAKAAQMPRDFGDWQRRMKEVEPRGSDQDSTQDTATANR